MKIFCINAWSLKPMNITKCCVSSLRWSARAFTAATSSLSTFSFVCSNWKKLVEIRWVTWSMKSIAFPCLEKLGLLLQDAFGSLSVCTVKRWPIKFCSICLNLNREYSPSHFAINPPTSISIYVITSDSVLQRTIYVNAKILFSLSHYFHSSSSYFT